jgi:FMN-dependent NADH-azoreductase
MKNVLLLTSSPRGELSHSTQVATKLAQEIGGTLTVRELWRNPPPTIGPEFVHAVYTPEPHRTAAQREALAFSDEFIAELRAADLIVIGAGMINFGIPASLKSWIDHVTRKGETFEYGESGPVGLLTGKKLVLVLAFGGVYSSGPMESFDHLAPALHGVLGFLGLTDVETIRIEGVAYGEEAAAKALDGAGERVRELVGSVG